MGVDALSFKDRLTLECSQSIREDYLHQSAFDDVDTYSSLSKQYAMLKMILTWYEKGQQALSIDVPFSKIISMKVREGIARMKYVREEDMTDRFASLKAELNQEYNDLMEGYDDAE